MAVENAKRNFAHALTEFELAWDNPAFTRFELPPVRVNSVLRQKYSVEPEKLITRSMVWDMEAKKAWDPLTYIPYVVSEGHSWGRHSLSDDSERFYRSSIQAAWIANAKGRVLEDVYVNHTAQRILFLGRTEFAADTGTVQADDFQPIFHVEHAVSGPENDPSNLWRIVILTEQKDERFTEPFKQMVARGLLPGFLEIYLENDLGMKLIRRSSGGLR